METSKSLAPITYVITQWSQDQNVHDGGVSIFLSPMLAWLWPPICKI